MNNEFNIHPICYHDMVDDELEKFKQLRDAGEDKKQADLSKAYSAEVNNEIEMIRKLEQSSLISFKYVYP